MNIGTSSKAWGTYRSDVDGLRAVAVVAVVAYHADPFRVPGGFIGVDIFFVISGYLICRLLLTELALNSFSLFKFYARRIKRLFPALAVVTATCLAVGWRLLPAEAYAEMGKEIAAGCAFIANLVFWGEAGYFDTDAHSKSMLHLWSLGVEEQFYIFWPLLLAWVWRRRYPVLTLIALILVASFALNVFEVKTHPLAAFYSPLTRFWELMIGCAWATLEMQDPTPCRASVIRDLLAWLGGLSWLRNVASITGAILITIGLAAISATDAYPGYHALVPTLGAILLIAAGPGAFLNSIVLSARPVVWVGKISYPLYLWHWVLLFFLDAYTIPRRETIAGAVALSFVLAWLTFVLLENPVRKKTSNARYLLPLTCTLSAIALLGVCTYVLSGVPSRFSPEANQLTPPPTEASYRYKQCFVDTLTQGEESFSQLCWDEAHSGEKLVLLWGDSHAAHLFPGLQQLQTKVRFRLIQLTSTGCSPLMGPEVHGTEACLRINRFVQAQVTRLRPAVVILGNRWSRDSSGVDNGLSNTTRFLRDNGVEQIIMFGSPPRWDPNLCTVLFWFYRQHGYVPSRIQMEPAVMNAIHSADQHLRKLAERDGARFLSSADVLCNSEGCITMVAPPPQGLMSPDYDHFTAMASEFVIASLYNSGDLHW